MVYEASIIEAAEYNEFDDETHSHRCMDEIFSYWKELNGVRYALHFDCLFFEMRLKKVKIAFRIFGSMDHPMEITAGKDQVAQFSSTNFI